MGLGMVNWIVFFGFIALVLFVGLYKSKGEDTHGETGAADYFLAGRGLSWWLIGFSLIAANISAEQFVGMSGQGAGLYGLSVASWEWIAAITLVVVAFVLLPYFLRSGITTIPEFLEVRYNHWARLLMTISMTIILILVSLIGVIYAGALTFQQLLNYYGTEVPMSVACWSLGGMAAIYVAIGGLKACAWADLLQGSALIIGGAIIAYFAFHALGIANVSDLVTAKGTVASVAQDSDVMGKFNALNSSAMSMGHNKLMPWPILLLGIWIPNFYYWGLNQYITQRILGSASLAEGQKGLVLAGFLKLIVPFIIVIPGIIAFNLFSADMEKSANADNPDKNVFAVYEKAMTNPQSIKIFKVDERWLVAHPKKAKEIDAYNKSVINRVGKDKVEQEKINPYKYDTALGLLITKLVPKNTGVLGFVLAALLGAIVSSLAAVLNAASTLLTMDVYQRYINPKAAQFKLVSMGRILIGVFVVIGCIVASILTSDSIFAFIQKYQGFVSVGVLAVFIYGLVNRSSGRWAGVIGLIANPIIYGIFVLWLFPEMSFLYSMSYTLLIVLAILFLYGMIWKADEKVVFENNTTMDLTSSKGALIWGLVVCVATVALYVIFW